MTKAFAYLRVSGKGQIDGDGFARQKAAIRDYAGKNNIKIVKWFEEKGVSGTKDLDDRPALSDLMVTLHSNGVTTVLIEKLDRLARDLMVQESIVADMQRNGFTLIPVLEPDMLQDDPSRKLMRQILGAFAEYEKTMIVLKLRGARQRKKAKTKAKVEGRKAFGELPGEETVLKRMKECRNQGMSYEAIAEVLNAESLKPRKGDAWLPSVVYRILTRTAA